MPPLRQLTALHISSLGKYLAYATIASMRRLGWTSAFLYTAATMVWAADQVDPLARARLLYNQRQFEAAVNAAEEARAGERADAADLIAARAYLERFRESAAAADLTSARDRLRRINPERFGAGERVEFIIGLAEALYLDQSAGAAAEVFESVLARREDLLPDARERVLDWWASALDRDVRPRPDIERQTVYRKIRDRMQAELGARPVSTIAAYWLAAAAWAQGDLRAAWDAAQAGWVLAPLARDRGATLRGELDRLVQRGIAPDRARALAQPADAVRLEWESFKERWNR